MNIEWLGWYVAVVLGVFALFQLALAVGAPFGHVVYGGRRALSDNRLAVGWRAGSGFAAMVLGAFAWVMLARSGAVATDWSDASVTFGSWLVVGYMALNTLGNLMAKHPVERWVFSAMTASVVIVGAVVAVVGPG
jgi:hypothetical protein